jgi:hypothetical protein
VNPVRGVALEHQLHPGREELGADVVRVLLVDRVLLARGRADADDGPVVRREVATTARGVGLDEILVGGVGIGARVAHVVVGVLGTVAHARRDDEVVRVVVLVLVLAAQCGERAT